MEQTTDTQQLDEPQKHLLIFKDTRHKRPHIVALQNGNLSRQDAYQRVQVAEGGNGIDWKEVLREP